MDKNNLIDPMEMLSLYFNISRRNQLDCLIESKPAKFQKIDIIKWVRISQIKGIFMRVYEKFGIISSDEKPDSFISEKMIQQVLYPKTTKDKIGE